MLTIIFNQPVVEPVPPIPPAPEIAVGVTPVRINEHFITFQLLDRPNTTIDEDFNEPIGGDLLSPNVITAVGQTNFRSGPFRSRTMTLSGDEELIRGHLIFTLPELIDKGLATEVGDAITFEFSKGDRIILVDGIRVDFEIVEIRTESPLFGDFLLVYIELVHGQDTRKGVPKR